MEKLDVDAGFWRGRRVLVTGHTGFKGSWLVVWLHKLGAEVIGYAREPDTNPNLFTTANVADQSTSVIGDVCDVGRLHALFQEHRPDVVFHLAAQALVRRSYADPVETYRTNVIGTAHVLEEARASTSVSVVVVITSDKCYENREWIWAYREIDALGGHDPYSSSKACAELVVAAYRNSFFPPERLSDHGVAVATARAGNVIGGGDWAPDRLVPDLVRSLQADETLQVRYPYAVRPWQHVLEPLAGYLILAQRLSSDAARYSQAWNFGPDESDVWTVRALTEAAAEAWPGLRIEYAKEPPPLHEAKSLSLDSAKARMLLGWRPRWQVRQALAATLDWYQRYTAEDNIAHVTSQQIDHYSQAG